jgi:hypothetical protein
MCYTPSLLPKAANVSRSTGLRKEAPASSCAVVRSQAGEMVTAYTQKDWRVKAALSTAAHGVVANTWFNACAL